MLEFVIDTSRAAMNLVFSGALDHITVTPGRVSAVVGVLAPFTVDGFSG